MLNGKLALHDIIDTEAFCIPIAQRHHEKLSAAYAQASRHYDDHAAQDFLAFLIAEAWELSLDFRPGQASFSTYAGTKLRHYGADNFIRIELKRTVWRFKDRTYQRPRPTVLSLDSELEHTQPSLTMDSPEHSLADLPRILRTRTSPTPPTHHPANRTATRRAA